MVNEYKPYIDRLKSLRLRPTKQRLAICKILFSGSSTFHFSIKNLDCDFVVHVSLNRGIRKRKETIDETTQEPDFYVFPASIIKKHRSPTDKINLNNIHDYNQYKNRWDLIEKMLVS